PRQIVLRAAQPVGFVGAEQRRDGAVWPGQAMQRRLVVGTMRFGADRQQPAFALHHDAARVERGRRHQRDAARPALYDRGADIFSAGAGLAKTAPGEQQPNAPFTWRRLLRVARAAVLVPVVVEFEDVVVTGLLDGPNLPTLRLRCDRA